MADSLTARRQAAEKAEANARKPQPNVAPVAPVPSGKGTYQQILSKNRNPNDPSLKAKFRNQNQRVQSFNNREKSGTVQPNGTVSFSDQD